MAGLTGARADQPVQLRPSSVRLGVGLVAGGWLARQLEMAAHANSATTNVHLHDPAAITVRRFPESEAGPFVSVRVEPVAALLVSDLAVLDALAVQVAAAREALAAMLSGQDPLPDADQTETVPLAVAR